MAHEEALAALDARRARALALGDPERRAARARAGILDARERIDRLADPGSFAEVGMLATSAFPRDRDRTPADGRVMGYIRIDGREAAIVSHDFTAMGASTSVTNREKIFHMKREATRRGLPFVLLAEASGARLPDTMGAAGMATLNNDYRRERETPWAAAVLGSCYGSAAFYTCCSDFRVMRRGAVMAVSGPRLVAQAVGEAVEAEALGGWRVHSEVTGLVDRVAQSDEEALDDVRRFLSYLPSNRALPPPDAPVPPGSGEGMADILRLLPERRTQVYDVRRLVRTIVDRDSFFELKAAFGRSASVGLARIGGKSVGIVANNPLVRGGAIDAQACEKITAFLVLCDSFNVPIVTLVDTPGFAIGTEAERQRALGRLMNFMNAVCLCTVPRIALILRKSYGQAYLNMGGGRNSDEVAAWPMAEVSFMDPAFAVGAIRGLAPGEDGYEAALDGMRRDSAVWGLAESFAVHTVVRPEETRDYLIRALDAHRDRFTGGVGRHLMGAWPTSA